MYLYHKHIYQIDYHRKDRKANQALKVQLRHIFIDSIFYQNGIEQADTHRYGHS